MRGRTLSVATIACLGLAASLFLAILAERPALASGPLAESIPAGPVVGWGSSVPPAVNGRDGTASAIAAGSLHSCAIQAENGGVVRWGRDFYGQSTPANRQFQRGFASDKSHSVKSRGDEGHSIILDPLLVDPGTRLGRKRVL